VAHLWETVVNKVRIASPGSWSNERHRTPE
jgi:hypothetical protein